jgi:hypothetical protein
MILYALSSRSEIVVGGENKRSFSKNFLPLIYFNLQAVALIWYMLASQNARITISYSYSKAFLCLAFEIQHFSRYLYCSLS